jgi:hypothetical protein
MLQKNAINEDSAIEHGMKEKAKEFANSGTEVYVKR